MKIESNKPPEGQAGRISQNVKNVPGSGAPAAPEKAAPAAKTNPADKVDISGKSREIADITAAVAQLPEVREAKVMEIKKAVDSGSYTVDPRKVAEQILKDL